VQYAAKMGFRTVGIARGTDKEPLARQLGADHYIDSQGTDPAAELQKLGGAKVVLATVTHGPAMSATVGGLAPHGKLLVLGAADKLEVSALTLLMGRRSVEGWYSGTSVDSEDTLNFSRRTNVRSMNEPYPLERAPGGVRPDDERQGAVPGGADDRELDRPAYRCEGAAHGARASRFCPHRRSEGRYN
jgi:D-arabinose 1-dehydrogenase-like Zn-dependent alcohol dehydrogenase